MTDDIKEIDELANAVGEYTSLNSIRCPVAREKARLMSIVKKTVAYIVGHREVIAEEILKEQKALVERVKSGEMGNIAQTPDRAQPCGMPTIAPISLQLAERLYDHWGDSVPNDLKVMEGRALHIEHQWFVIKGEPRLVEEPNYTFLIDPAPAGWHITTGHCTDMMVATTLTLEPYSIWQGNYSGVVIRGGE